MDIELDDLCEGLLDALEKFDGDILPLGLYSSDEITNDKGQRAQNLGQYQEWPRAVVPYLNSLGTRVTLPQWSIDGLGTVEIRLARAAAIKVRRYGSGYQMDKREFRDWGASEVYGVYQLFSQPPAPTREPLSRVALLVAFDKTATPLGGKIRYYNDLMRLEENRILFRTRCWMDKAKRGFGVRVAVWACHHSEPAST